MNYGYTRCSTQEQAESGLGLDAQRAAIDANGPVAGWFSDEGVSGAAPMSERVGLVAALDALKAGDALVVARRDRLGRDEGLVGWFERQVENKGAGIVSAAGEGSGDDTPTGRFVRRMLDLISQLERDTIRARITAAMRAKKARGERAGNIPFGSALATDGVRLVPEPVEQAALDRIKELAGTHGRKRIAGILMSEGHKTRRGGRWSPTVVGRLIARAG